MIGNDIVDLKYAAIESNWKRPRFLDKVFTEEEQQLILNSDNAHQMTWLLWSMKESAYKIYVQQHGKRFFNPKKLRCELISFKKGYVYIENNLYFTTSFLTKALVYSIARSSETSKICDEYIIVKTENISYKTQSDITKKRLLEVFSELIKRPITSLDIIKNQVGTPKLYDNNNEIKQSFSITHHGRFGAYAISI